MRVIVTTALCVLALSACATPPVIPPVLDLAGYTCTASPALDAPTVLVYDKKDEKEQGGALHAGGPCLEDARGAKSLYATFALPDTSDPYLITVASSTAGGSVLAPRVILLDAAGMKTRDVGHDLFMFRSGALSALFRSRPGERYLIVASDPDEVGKGFTHIAESTQETMMAAGTATFTMHTGSDVAADHVFSHAGGFFVTIAPLPVAK